MNKEFEIADALRTQLLGGLHIGRLRPGSRLPSIREIAERHGVDHRVAARAYTHLENEQLVQIRGRSGVYVADAAKAETRALDGRMRWLATVMCEARTQRTTFAELYNLMRRATLHRLRCACVESTNDHLIALSAELASDFGFTVAPLRFSCTRFGVPELGDAVRIEAEIRAADLVVTTAFHANAIAEIARRADRPLLVIAINPMLRDEIARRMKAGPLRVVMADPAFLARAQLFLSGMPGSVQLQLVSDYQARPARDDVPTIFTRAARRELGLPEFHLLGEHVAFIGEESATRLCEAIVQLSAAR